MLPCRGCAYRRDIPGNAHSRCRFDWVSHDLQGMCALIVAADLTPHTAQWFRFPFNYDPVWGPETCPQRTETLDPTKEAPTTALTDLLSLLG